MNRQLEPDFRGQAEKVIVAMRKVGADLHYDRASVVWLDAYIEKERSGFTEEDYALFAELWGIFLGECMISTYGGVWHFDEKEQQYGVKVTGADGTAFPMTKAFKQMSNGPEDSIASFFDVIGAIAKVGGVDKFQTLQKDVAPHERQAKPWWKRW